MARYICRFGYPQGAPQSAIEVNNFVLGWDEHIYIQQLRDKGELELLALFGGSKRYLDDGFVVADRLFADKRYKHVPFTSPYTGAQMDGIYRTI